MKQLFKTFRRNSGSNTLTGLSEKAEGILSKAVELWPMLQRPFAKDPIEDAIETEAGFRGKTMADLQLPVWFIVLVRFYYSFELCISWNIVWNIFFKHQNTLFQITQKVLFYNITFLTSTGWNKSIGLVKLLQKTGLLFLFHPVID